MPGDARLESGYPVHDVVCEDAVFGYWSGLNEVWDSDRTLVNLEHDMEYSDDLVAELLSCPHPLCTFPYKVRPFGWPGKTWGVSFGSIWVTEGQPYASFSSIGFCKIAPEVREGTTLDRNIWSKVEASIHLAAVQSKRVWHVHWPAIQHYHDYDADGIDAETGSLYNVVKRARDEGRLIVYGDPMSDDCLERLKENDPFIYDESFRERAQAVCLD